MEAPTPLSVEQILEQERGKLASVNQVLWERAQKEWRAKQWDQRTVREILLATRATVIDLYIDLVERKRPLTEALLYRPERWVGIGIFLLALGLFVYLIDVLG